MTVDRALLSPSTVRQLCRANSLDAPTTAGFSAGHNQANIIILPERFAADFRGLCRRNPVSCPLLGETAPGDPTVPAELAADSDIRTDCPAYFVYKNGRFSHEVNDMSEFWAADSVAFFIGCSYGFETSLVRAGFVPRQIELGRNVPMYKTRLPLLPSGVFHGFTVVSMRPYPAADLEAVRGITRPHVAAHGEPIAWGAEGLAMLGLDPETYAAHPDFGDPSEVRPGEIPVFWACGVTPQLAVMNSEIEGIVVGHAPGQMLVLDQLA